jgi:DraIII
MLTLKAMDEIHRVSPESIQGEGLMKLCLRELPSRSKYGFQRRFCQREEGHSGRCDEFPFLADLAHTHKSVATKIIRDSVMTTGAAWKSEDAGPNRILRWVMLLSDAELKKDGINMAGLKPQVVAKLREKAATYDDCIASAKMLTWLAYQMTDAPQPSEATRKYLEGYSTLDLGVGPTTPTIARTRLLGWNVWRRWHSGHGTIHGPRRISSGHVMGICGRIE